jgi:hypothetical protein
VQLNGIDTGRGEDTLAWPSSRPKRRAARSSSGMGWSASDPAGWTPPGNMGTSLRQRSRGFGPCPGGLRRELGPCSVADLIDNMLAPRWEWPSSIPDRLAPGRMKADGKRTPPAQARAAVASSSITAEGLIFPAMGNTSSTTGRPDRPRPDRKGVWKGVFSNSYHAYLYGFEPRATVPVRARRGGWPRRRCQLRPTWCSGHWL